MHKNFMGTSDIGRIREMPVWGGFDSNWFVYYLNQIDSTLPLLFICDLLLNRIEYC